MAISKLKIPSQTVHVDFEDYIGDTLDISFNWKDETGTALNLTGWTALLQVKAAKTDSVALIERSTANSDLVLSDGTGDFNVETQIAPLETTNLGVGKWFYDLQMTSPAGRVNTLVIGTITLLQDNSR